MEADQRSFSSDVGLRGPSSPETSPVQLSDILVDALRFVLSASLLPDGPDLALSRDYCSRLLEDEPPAADFAAAAHPIRHDENFHQGVPAYPLYKRLTRALERCIDSGRLEGPANSMVSVPLDGEFWQSKESEWNRLISEKGSELLKMLQAVDFGLHVQEPFFSQLKGCTLTEAARALAKHVNRCSDGWWGDFRGSDSNKNMLALKLINHLLTNCCWMNIHLVQPCKSFLEIRVPEGYGARWSKDGLKFIGFLEPYTEEGFSKGWKH